MRVETRKTDKKEWGLGGIEPPTSPTLKENHTTRPMPRTLWRSDSTRIGGIGISAKTKKVLGMGFEPTPPKRLELESSALDRSAIQA